MKVDRPLDEYGFPLPVDEDGTPVSRRSSGRRHVLLLILLPMFVVGVGVALVFGPQVWEAARQGAESLLRDLEQGRGQRSSVSRSLRRANRHLQQQRWGEAVQDLEVVLEQFPQDPQLRGALAQALNNHAYEQAVAGRDLEAGLEQIKRALDLAPPPANAAYIDTRGYIYFRLGRYPEALTDLDQAVHIAETDLEHASPGDAAERRRSLIEILLHRADALDKLNRPDDAKRDRQWAGDLGAAGRGLL